ncbi:MAG: hypothetical protein QOD39_504 [Mycobacterium sp.]|nr:hypothetical protein [Mycobacterium sp.]
MHHLVVADASVDPLRTSPFGNDAMRHLDTVRVARGVSSILLPIIDEVV